MSKSPKPSSAKSAQWTAQVPTSPPSEKKRRTQGHGLSRSLAIVGVLLVAVAVGIVVNHLTKAGSGNSLRELVARDVNSIGRTLSEKEQHIGQNIEMLAANIGDQQSIESAGTTFRLNAPRVLEGLPASSALVLASRSTPDAPLEIVDIAAKGSLRSAIDSLWLSSTEPNLDIDTSKTLSGGILLDSLPLSESQEGTNQLIWYAAPPKSDNAAQFTLLSFISISSLINDTLPNELALSHDVRVTYKNADGQQRLIMWRNAIYREGESSPAMVDPEETPSQQYLLDVRGDTLSVLFNPTLAWIQQHESPLPRILLILSLSTIGLAAVVMFILSRHTAVIENRVTQRTEELAESERQLEVRNRTLNSILERSPDLMMLQNREGKFRYSNPRTHNVLSADLNGRTPAEIARTVSGHSRQILMQIAEGFNAIAQGATSNRFEAVTVAAGNVEEIHLDILQVPVRNDEGQIVRVLTVGRNITEQRTQLSRLKQAQRRIAALLEDTATAIIEWDTQQKVVAWNPAAERIFGYTRDEALGMPIKTLIPATAAGHLTCPSGNPLATDSEETSRVWQTQTKDGQVVATQWQNTIVHDEKGNPATTTSFIFDVTRRILAETSLQEREVVLRALANSSLEFMQGSEWEQEARSLLGALLECNTIDRVSLVRQRLEADEPDLEAVTVWQNVAGQPNEVDISCYEEITKENQQLVCQAWIDTLRQGAEISGSLPDFDTPDREKLQAIGVESLLIIPLFKQDLLWGFLRFDHHTTKQSWSSDQIDALRVVGAVLSTAITKQALDHKQSLLERRLLSAQKRESLGILASGVANNFNELISAILGNASLARTQAETHTTIDDCLASIETDGLKASDLCREMLLYSGHNEGNIGLASINIILLEAIAQLRHSISDKIEIVTDFASGLPVVEGDAEQLKQAIYNVLLNAAEAMVTSTGLIRIQTGIAVAPSQNQQNSELSEDDQTRVFIRITDTGCGIDSRSLDHIFDPFFSTKAQGRGLGLTLVQTAIEAHEGSIKVTSEIDHGTVVNISLPSRNQGDLKRHTARVRPLLQLNGTVLYAESDSVQRAEGVAILRKFGLRVDAVSDGQQAVDLISARPDRYLLVIMDLRMPVMDGLTALTQILKLHDNQRIILTSSRSFTSETHRLVDEGIAVTIEKPLDEAQLSGAIQQLLDRYPAH
ncbi:PAS domain-containing sensor histidine kinase [Sulfuriroseicoccus oceanibius]|uniref:histidine kinase n=1 Tax=Sulfuriroseicoccus oceanibius TaxID=2707525 RepID=A0A6B3L5Z7_9BACT|nr:PAS domain-containing sensor histidine kinase [Sulfuriroseicoccus oceanibius]QQL45981.1 PAS domain S-box protein [Sulfuriroseicoccus oceanibius]